MQTTFEYGSLLWTNKETWNVDEGLDGLTQNEAKLASYHNTPFTKVCLGMTWNGVTNWIHVNHNASSLYSVIADRKYRATNLGREEWMSLINGALLQPNCNLEGFNLKFLLDDPKLKVRIGIASNEQYNCHSSETAIGFGIRVKDDIRIYPKLSSANIQIFPETQTLETFGYIFIQ